MLTGRHAARSGLIVDVEWGKCGKYDTKCSDVIHPNNRGHLPTGEITLAEALKINRSIEELDLSHNQLADAAPLSTAAASATAATFRSSSTCGSHRA